MIAAVKTTLTEIAGWYGAAAIVLAYALVTFGALDNQGVPYQLLNLTGAAGIVALSLTKGALQPAVLNVIWFLVALVALARIVL